MRKITRQSEVTPTKTIDEYLWNERLGVTQLPPVDDSQGQANTSSLPPQASAAPTIDYDSSSGQSDMYGSGVSGQGQLIAPKAPTEAPRSTPAVSKAAASSSTYLDNCPDCGKKILDYDMDGYECNDGQRWCGTHHPKSCTDHNRLDLQKEIDDSNKKFFDLNKLFEANKTSAVSTLYGDVNPTPTTGDANNGSQAGRGSTPDDLPNGPDSKSVSPAAAGEEEGGAGLASELGEAASVAAFASKHFIGSVLDPKEAKYKYIRHNAKTGKWEIWSKKTGKTLSTHASKSEAESAFRAMESHLHG